ncbi:MAG TPA: TonB-dependent receptor [Chitinophagaceae bacterium]|nr:TonB-dependent receptor [Chitinophagaceae bacterium]
MFAQIIKQDTLKNIIVKDRKIKTSVLKQQIDSVIIQHNQLNALDQVLQLNSTVFVKNYGVGAMSTLSMRGASAAQTSLKWEGLNINNALNGLSDISNIPIALFDKIDIQYASDKNAEIAGSISIENDKPTFQKEEEISYAYHYESLKNHFGNFKLKIANNQSHFDIKTFYKSSKNQFDFYNETKERKDTLTHASSITKGILSNFYYLHNPYNETSVHVWWQEMDRNIPPATFEDYSRKHEFNQSIRTILKHHYYKNKFSSKTILGVFKDSYQYQDSSIFLSSDYSSLDLSLTENMQYHIAPQQSISLETSYRYSTFLKHQSKDIQRLSLHLLYENSTFLKNVYFKLFFQKEFSTIFELPYTAGCLIKQTIFNNHYLFLSLNKSYRAPTLNELYYEPGGNEQLKPEIGYNIDVGIENHFKLNHQHSIKNKLSIFNRNVSNWIVWYGGSILSPHNLQEVWSRGLDIDFTYKNTFDKNKNHYVSFNILYAYILSTTLSSPINNDYSIGKQIPYTPRYQFKTQCQLNINNINLMYVYNYTGYRFITTDESEWLTPFQTHNLFCSYLISLKKNTFKIHFSIQNIFNKNYQTVIGRTMPSTHFSFGLTGNSPISFLNKNK